MCAGAVTRPVQGGGTSLPRATRRHLRQRLSEDQVSDIGFKVLCIVFENGLAFLWGVVSFGL